MSGPAADGRGRAAPDPRASQQAVLALGITLAIQIFTAVAATATSVLATEIGRDLGLAPTLIGPFVGLIFAGAMIASLVSGTFIERYGPIRVSQVSVLLCAVGIAMTAAVPPSAAVTVVALILAPLIIGLGYGAITPASSQLLARTTPPSRRSLTFSIKQTGVPAGAALAGAVLPPLALATSWRAAFAMTVGAGVAIALIAESVRANLDVGRAAASPPTLARIIEPLRHVLRTPPLLELSAVAFVYASLQACLLSFLVVYLAEKVGFSLVAAGLALTVAMVAGVVGRILWGMVADFRVAPRLLLSLIGIAAGLCSCATAGFVAVWPMIGILAVCALFGLTASGWNGVQLAEVARISPPAQVGSVTGASNFISFGGIVVGPPLFAVITALTGDYRYGFAVFGGAAICSGVWLLARRRK